MRRLIACLTLAAAAFLCGAALADEPEVVEAPEPDAPEVERATDDAAESARPLRLFGEATSWFTQPIGADYVYATALDTTSAVSTRTLNQEFGTSDRVRWRAGAVVKGDVGAFVMTFWSVAVQEPISLLTPGRFVLGESLAYPLFAGLNNDGLADGVTAYSQTSTRDLRLDFVRDAFRSGRMSAKWLAGLRFIDHSQAISAVYYALVPGLPPLIDESGASAIRLIPEEDRAGRRSQFSGRGIETGFEASYELLPAVHLEGSFVYALLRGETRASYVSTTRYYTFTDSATEEEFYVPPSLYELVFGDPAFYEALNQRALSLGLQDRGSSNSASVLEASLGFRWRAWRTLEVLGGIRQNRYQDVILELRPRDATLAPDGSVNIQALDKEYRSIGYEGFYLGVAYTY